MIYKVRHPITTETKCVGFSSYVNHECMNSSYVSQ